MRTVALAALAIAAVLGFAPRPADACSCDDLLRVTPADGAVDVPVNVEIVVDTGPDGSPAGGPPPYVLTGPDGPVEIEYERIVEQQTYSIDLVRPVEPLAPLTEYVLVGQGSGGQRGVEVSFRTGSEADTTAPSSVEAGDLTLAYAESVDTFSCGDEYYFIDFPLTAPDDAAAIDLVVAGEHYVVTREKIPWGLTNWSGSCGLAIRLEPGLEYCFEARARDLAGNLGEPVQRCATVTACPEIDTQNDDSSPDLTDCNDPAPEPPPESSGCSTMPAAGVLLPLAAMLLLVSRRRSRR